MAERVTVEHNGELVTLEVPDGTSDEEIKSFLTGSETKKETTAGVGPIAPTYVPGQTGLAELGQDVVGAVKPMVEAGKDIFAGYAKSPGKAIVDIGAAHLGIPPPYAAYEGFQGAKNMFNAGKESIQNFGDALSQLPKATIDRVEPSIKYFQDALGNGKTFEEFKNLKDKVGIEKAIKNFEYPESLANNPKFNAAKNQITDIFPTLSDKFGRIAGPILHGASKIAGPVVAGIEGYQGYNQAKQGDYTGAGLSGLGVASALNPFGLIAQPGISMMQSANQNFKQQTPAQQQESAMEALSGQGMGQAGEYFPQYTDQDKIDKAIRAQAAKQALRPIAPTPIQ